MGTELLGNDSRWRHPPFQAPHPLRSWLTHRGSLTARLRARYPDFRVQVLRAGLARPWRDECRPLVLAHPWRGFRREVLLLGCGRPCVFAHSFAPYSALRQGFQGLARQGSRPLGATLFANPRVQRSPLGFARLDPRHPLWRAAQRHIGGLPPQLWARRSCFVLGRARLLVTEVFLPAHTEQLP